MIDAQLAGGIGVWGDSATGVGVAGSTGGNGPVGNGVEGNYQGGGAGAGVHATSASSQSVGLYAQHLGGGSAGSFIGNVTVAGRITSSTKGFRIDHPLDPAAKYLAHSSVESPDMMNVYNGNVVTDGNGEASVDLPEYFEALNGDFRYQLTVIGQFAQAIVSREIEGNRFAIRTDRPNVKVSWQVTGIRSDPCAHAYRIVVEESKGERERGRYLHPELYPSDSTAADARRPIGWLPNVSVRQEGERAADRTRRTYQPV